MAKLELIPNFDSKLEKCKTCMLTKITRKPFPKIDRCSTLFELVQSDICAWFSHYWWIEIFCYIY